MPSGRARQTLRALPLIPARGTFLRRAQNGPTMPVDGSMAGGARSGAARHWGEGWPTRAASARSPGPPPRISPICHGAVSPARVPRPAHRARHDLAIDGPPNRRPRRRVRIAARKSPPEEPGPCHDVSSPPRPILTTAVPGRRRFTPTWPTPCGPRRWISGGEGEIRPPRHAEEWPLRCDGCCSRGCLLHEGRPAAPTSGRPRSFRAFGPGRRCCLRVTAPDRLSRR